MPLMRVNNKRKHMHQMRANACTPLCKNCACVLLVHRPLISDLYCSFLKVKLGRLRRKIYKWKYDIHDKNLPTVLAKSSNHSRAQHHDIECKKATCSWKISHYVP